MVSILQDEALDSHYLRTGILTFPDSKIWLVEV